MSTKEVVLKYLKENRGREITVNEIKHKFNYKLARISNAIKELELSGEIKIERRPLKKGKYTIISLIGDNITQFASHEREIERREDTSQQTTCNSGLLPINELIKLLNSFSYQQEKFENLIRPFYTTYFTLIFDVIQPIMYEVGNKWQTGELTVADEHIISSRMEKFVTGLIKSAPNKNMKTIVLAPVEHEQHSLPLLILELILSEKGINAINLSRTINISNIISFIKKLKVKPDWIFFSATTNSFINNLHMDIQMIKDKLKIPYPKIAIGGQGFYHIDPVQFTEADEIIKTNSQLENFLNSL